MNEISTAVEKVNAFKVMSVMQRAQELERDGHRVVHMEVGEPDFSSAQPIVDSAKEALDKGYTQYTAATGILPLRQALAEYYQRHYGVSVDYRRILITPGASGGLTLLANMLVGKNDGVLVSDPAYPCVRNFIHLMNAEPQLMPVGPEQNFQPCIADYERHSSNNTRGLWLASPSNPTGTILTREDLQEASDWTRSKGIHLLVDEIYHGLHYVDSLPSVLEVDQDAFVVNSFSKYFGMTGWRLGWIVVPARFIETATKLAQNLYISASSIAQYAALAAFEPQSVAIFEERRMAFRQRRDYLSGALNELGITVPESIQGAFYVYADISSFSDDSEKFCEQLLEQQYVAVTPGTDFGEFNGKSFVRFAFTTSMENLELGILRLREFLKKS
ncbi:MAG: aminotransferase class I/II-fold pyridoxal phosphate-dependent enzyme [Pseudohongiellaceae bacterium]